MRHKFKTIEEINAIKQTWRKKFAWRPVKTTKNLWVWWEYVYTRKKMIKHDPWDNKYKWLREYSIPEDVVLAALKKD